MKLGIGKRSGNASSRGGGCELTPAEIVSALDRHVVGQKRAKRAVAVAIRNRWRRMQLDDDMRAEVLPKNILLIGATGVGKTEIARRIANLIGAPFTKVEATKYTEVGYVGRDVESIIRDLTASAMTLVKASAKKTVETKAADAAEARILDALVNAYKPGDPDLDPLGLGGQNDGDSVTDLSAVRVKLRQRLQAGALDDREIDIDVQEAASTPLGNIFDNPSFAQTGIDFSKMFEQVAKQNKSTKRMTVREARRALVDEEAENLVDSSDVESEAVKLVENQGIVFLDEIDKVAGSDRAQGADVSRQGVQRDLLPLVEGCTVHTRFGPVSTDHILFIAAGAFHVSKPSDLLPELQGRLPIRVRLDKLREEDFVRILKEPKNALTRQYEALMATEGVRIRFAEDGIAEVARVAAAANALHENIGARRLSTIMERVLEEVSFEGSALKGRDIVIDRAYVASRTRDLLEDQDLGQFVL